ncbi:MAG: glycosyltransferase, partial [Eubacteriales bacterium]
KIGELEKWFQSYGSEIFHVTPRSVNPIKNVREIASVIKRGNYDVVHCHQDYHGAIAMLLAKHYGVEKRIIHCHRAFPPEKWYHKIIRGIETFIIKKPQQILWHVGYLRENGFTEKRQLLKIKSLCSTMQPNWTNSCTQKKKETKSEDCIH